MEIRLDPIKKAISHFLRRFHVTIFVITILGGLGVIILLLNNVVISSGDSGDYTPDTNSATFDQATIDQIKQLKTRSDANSKLDLSGRTNPFVE